LFIHNGGTHFPYWTGDPLKAERIIGNYFGTVTNSDQCASGVDDYSYCVGNVFDKRGQGTGTGSSKTYGGSQYNSGRDINSKWRYR
jgi:hypothetical protein